MADSGLGIEDAVSDSDKFEVGAAVINEMTLKLNNFEGAFNKYEFKGAVFKPWVGLTTKVHWRDGEIIEKIPKGVFTCNESPIIGSIISVTADDNMSKFDAAYSKSTLKYPATLGQIAADVCAVCGVTLATATFPNSTYSVATRPSESSITCREIISYVAQLAGCFARCNSSGALEIKWYEEAYSGENTISGTSISLPQNTGAQLTKVLVAGQTVETGTGDKSPDNPYTLTGTTALTVSDGGSNSQDYLWAQTGYSLPNGTHDTKDFVSNVEIHNVGKTVLDGSEVISVDKVYTNTVKFTFIPSGIASVPSIIADRFTTINNSNSDVEHVAMWTGWNGINVFILKSRLSGWSDSWTNDEKVTAFKAWLKNNPVTVLYQLAVPQMITGTAESIQTYAAKTIISNNNKADMTVSYKTLWNVGKYVASYDVDTADTVVTGVKIQGNDDNKTVYSTGTDDFVLRISDNPLAQDNLQSLVNTLGTKFNGFTFRAYTVSSPANPAIEAGDIVNMTDKSGVTHKTLVSHISYEYGESERYSADAETLSENQSERFTAAEKAQESADEAQKTADEANAGVDKAKTEIAQLNGEITLKADKGNLVAEINISPESIKISADKLELSGLVTISNLENGDTIIDGGCIKTGKIESQDGKWWLNLGTGEVHMEKGAFSGVISWGGGTTIKKEDSGVLTMTNVDAIQIGATSGDVNIFGNNQIALSAEKVGIEGKLYANGERGITTQVGVTLSDGGKRTLQFTDGILTDNDA